MKDLTNQKVIIIAGPTASGKTDLAIRLAKSLNTEIISADSRIVYKNFDIGTAKPSPEELKTVKHHLIDIVEPTFNYTVAMYQKQAREIISQLHKQGKIPILAGGTGFYIRAVVDGLNLPNVEPDEQYRQYLTNFAKENGNEALHKKLQEIDPATAEKLHVNDLFRVIRALEVYHKTGKPISSLQNKKPSAYDLCYIVLSAENRDFLYNRINQRVLTMLECGLINEVKFLISKYGKTLSLLKTLGYKEVVDFLESRCSYDQMIENIQKNTRHFARRQLIWFRSDNRIHWYHIDKQSTDNIISSIQQKLQENDR